MFRLLVFSAALAAAWFLTELVFPAWVHPQVWFMVGFLFVVTAAGNWYLQGRLAKDRDNIMVPYLLFTFVRLVASLVFILALVRRNSDGLVVLLGNFFLLYFLYVGFEIHRLLTNLRRNSDSLP